MKRIYLPLLFGLLWLPAGAHPAWNSNSPLPAASALSPRSELNSGEISNGKFESFKIITLKNPDDPAQPLLENSGNPVEIHAEVVEQGKQGVFPLFVGRGAFVSKMDLKLDRTLFHFTGVESIDAEVQDFFYGRFLSNGRVIVLENTKDPFGIGTVLKKTPMPYLVLSSKEMLQKPVILCLALAQALREINPEFDQKVTQALRETGGLAVFRFNTKLRELLGANSYQASMDLRFLSAIKALAENRSIQQGNTNDYATLRRGSLIPNAPTASAA